MTPEVDAGPCIAKVSTPINPEETSEMLEERLAEIGGWALRRAVDSVEEGNLQALPQDPKLASKAPRLKKNRRIDRLESPPPRRSRTTFVP